MVAVQLTHMEVVRESVLVLGLGVVLARPGLVRALQRVQELV